MVVKSTEEEVEEAGELSTQVESGVEEQIYACETEGATP
jgi:hypothetical protein